jgi:hypothetical protein
VAYFNGCIELGPDMTRYISRDLFYTYLYKITEYYHDNLGFSLLMIGRDMYIFYLIILSLSFYFFKVWGLAIVGFFISIQIVYSIRKSKIKKGYGPFK